MILQTYGIPAKYAAAPVVIFLLAIAHLILPCRTEEKIFSVNSCIITEPVYGHKFDFTGLRSDLAHQVLSSKSDQFEFNICSNLTRSCNNRTDVAACLKRNGKEYVLGTKHTLNYRNGKMFFEFSGGEKCQNGSEYQLHVFLGCDYTQDVNPMQVTSYADDTCSFYITLETALACLPEPDEVKSNSCSVHDSNTGHTYDLLPLSDFNYRALDRNGSAFVINVCKPVLYGENAMCPPGSSVCFISLKSTDFKKKFFNYGTVQTKPVIENGKLLMRHSSLTPCNSTTNYSSIIYFYCDKDVMNAHPEMIGVHGCVYEFSFVTPLACIDVAPCTVVTRDGGLLDMTPLKDKLYSLNVTEKNYALSICSNAQGAQGSQGVSCIENDGACIIADGQSKSLGKINSNLRYNQTGSAYLLYEGGAVCQPSTSDSATAKYWSTKIEFICGNNATKDNKDSNTVVQQQQGPKIIENSNCQLLVHFQTELACQKQITCKTKVYVDHSEDGTGVEVLDLTPLISATKNYEARIDDSLMTSQQVAKTTKFFLNVCRPLVSKFGLGCPGGSAACMAEQNSSLPNPEEEKSLGFPLASPVAINRTTAEIRYYKGSPCPTDIKSELSMGIQFYCDMRAGRGTPVLRTISDCHYAFSWATNVICLPHMCNFDADTCEINNDEINVRYNLKTAPFTDSGKIKIEEDKHEFTFDVCGPHRKAVTDYSQGLVNLFFSTNGPCNVDGNVNVQMRLICSAETEHATSFTDSTQCNLVYVQRTPDICKFLGLEVPPKLVATTQQTPSSSSSSSTTTTTTTTTTKPPNSDATSTKQPLSSDNHPAERTGNVGAILAAILSITSFVSCLAVFALSPQRRNAVRRLFRRSSSAVRYSRVQSNEEANLLLEPNGEFTDSDDDMLL